MNLNDGYCHHCLGPVSTPFTLKVEDKKYLFCCQGCKIVFQAMRDHGLGKYYEFEGRNSHALVGLKAEDYSYLDYPQLKESFFNQTTKQLEVRLLIQDAHCSACLWVMEKLPELVQGVRSSRLNLNTKVLHLQIEPKAMLSKVATKIHQLGYRPLLIESNTKEEALKKRRFRRELIRVAVAFFCTGNIMLYTVPQYSGLLGPLSRYFDLFSILLSIPVVTYCAYPFYRATFGALKNRNIGIDTSLSFAIVFGEAISLYHSYIGSAQVYYDSLCMLVFLILGSRLLLEQIQERGASLNQIQGLFVEKSLKTSLGPKPVKFISIGDNLILDQPTILPVDIRITHGEAYFSSFILNGESVPVLKKVGDNAKAGEQFLGGKTEASVTKAFLESELGVLIEKAQRSWGTGSQTTRLSSLYAKYLLISVLILILIFTPIFISLYDIETALYRLLSLVIITCPCALGLVIPMTSLSALKILVSKNIIVKEDETLERLSTIDHVFLDKTGTLTSQAYDFVFEIRHKNPDLIESLLYSLESYSSHPLARSIKQYLASKNSSIKKISLDHFHELPGKYLRAEYDGDEVEVTPLQDKENTGFQMKYQGHNVLTGTMDLLMTKGIHDFIAQLKSLSLKISLLSGDATQRVKEFAQKIGLPENKARGELSAQDKADIMAENSGKTLMIGDGANDTLAFKAADVSIAVKGGMELALKVCDIFMADPKLTSIPRLILFTRKYRRLLILLISLSVLYNFVGIFMSLAGLITPLVAAILMPASSLFFLFLSLLSLNSLNKQILS